MASAGKIFGIGLSKTGTTSLYAALQRLGYRTITFGHMRELGLEDWIDGDFSRDYLAHVDAATDLPIGTYFRELDERYPGSKFILTHRDAEPWLASVKRQFEANPNPKHAFHRTVRLAHYGVGVFNEGRFRRLHQDHIKAVRAHFADHPEQLLEIDLFSGEGWSELCGFLGRDVPDQPFPNTKPGHREPTANRSHMRTSFVIPVVNPGGAKIENYDTVEDVLRLTLTSIRAQRGASCSIVVVCHQVPAWAAEMGEHMHFLDVADHPGFAASRNHVQIDKGMKYIVGSAFALEVLRADNVMLADADDFLDRDLAAYLSGANAPMPGADGWILTRGYHLALRKGAAGLELNGAFEVKEYNRTCGTCRIFLGPSLHHHIEAFCPEVFGLAAMMEAKPAQVVPTALLDSVVNATDPIEAEPDSLVRLLGRHIRQASRFVFATVDKPLAAKGCGHGNHDGPRQGDIHWHRVVKTEPLDGFAASFGLSDVALKPKLKMRLKAFLGRNRLIKGRRDAKPSRNA